MATCGRGYRRKAAGQRTVSRDEGGCGQAWAPAVAAALAWANFILTSSLGGTATSAT